METVETGAEWDVKAMRGNGVKRMWFEFSMMGSRRKLSSLQPPLPAPPPLPQSFESLVIKPDNTSNWACLETRMEFLDVEKSDEVM